MLLARLESWALSAELGARSQDRWFYVRSSALPGRSLDLTQSFCLRADTQAVHKGPRVQ